LGCLAWIGRRGDLSEGGCAWRGLEFAILRMAASHGLIASGDLSGDDFVYWEHEFAMLRLAASYGLVAGATFPRMPSRGGD
jgi:hypothetical protein